MEVAKYYSASFCCRPKPLTCYKNLKSEIYILDIQPFMVIGLSIFRLDRRASIQFGRVHFGVFSMFRFMSPALSSDWTWPALSSVICHPPSVLCPPSFGVCHLSSVICHSRGVPTDWKWWFFVTDRGSQLTGSDNFLLLTGIPTDLLDV